MDLARTYFAPSTSKRNLLASPEDNRELGNVTEQGWCGLSLEKRMDVNKAVRDTSSTAQSRPDEPISEDVTSTTLVSDNENSTSHAEEPETETHEVALGMEVAPSGLQGVEEEEEEKPQRRGSLGKLSYIVSAVKKKKINKKNEKKQNVVDEVSENLRDENEKLLQECKRLKKHLAKKTSALKQLEDMHTNFSVHGQGFSVHGMGASSVHAQAATDNMVELRDVTNMETELQLECYEKMIESKNKTITTLKKANMKQERRIAYLEVICLQNGIKIDEDLGQLVDKSQSKRFNDSSGACRFHDSNRSLRGSQHDQSVASFFLESEPDDNFQSDDIWEENLNDDRLGQALSKLERLENTPDDSCRQNPDLVSLALSELDSSRVSKPDHASSIKDSWGDLNLNSFQDGSYHRSNDGCVTGLGDFLQQGRLDRRRERTTITQDTVSEPGTREGPVEVGKRTLDRSKSPITRRARADMGKRVLDRSKSPITRRAPADMGKRALDRSKSPITRKAPADMVKRTLDRSKSPITRKNRATGTNSLEGPMRLRKSKAPRKNLSLNNLSGHKGSGHQQGKSYISKNMKGPPINGAVTSKGSGSDHERLWEALNRQCQ